MRDMQKTLANEVSEGRDPDDAQREIEREADKHRSQISEDANRRAWEFRERSRRRWILGM